MTPTAKKYKSEAEEAQRKARQAQWELDQMKKKCEEDKKQRWDAIVYCENCQEVTSVNIPKMPDSVNSTSCAICGHKGGQHLVRKVNCERTK